MRHLRALAVAAIVALAVPASASASAPSASLLTPTVAATSATLQGTVTPGDENTSYQFLWGATSVNENATSAQIYYASAGTPPGIVSAQITGLHPGVTYHYLLRVSNTTGGADSVEGTFPTPIIAPTATLASSTIDGTTVTMQASLDGAGQDTSYYFEYGTTASYGNATTASTLYGGYGGAQIVSGYAQNLAARTLYHFHLIARNESGTMVSGDGTFTTGDAPPGSSSSSSSVLSAVTLDPASVEATAATLAATVNPGGLATSVLFEYGTTTRYGATTAAQALAPGTNDVPVSARVDGLKPGTTYHARVVATNASGSQTGGDVTFTAGAAATSFDHIAPHATLSLPVCARSLAPAACGRFRGRVSAWRTLRGTVSDAKPSAGVVRVEVNVIRALAESCLVYDGRRFAPTNCKTARATWVKVPVRGRAWSLAVRDLGPGPYLLRARAVDGAGNVQARPSQLTRVLRGR